MRSKSYLIYTPRPYFRAEDNEPLVNKQYPRPFFCQTNAETWTWCWTWRSPLMWTFQWQKMVRRWLRWKQLTEASSSGPIFVLIYSVLYWPPLISTPALVWIESTLYGQSKIMIGIKIPRFGWNFVCVEVEGILACMPKGSFWNIQDQKLCSIEDENYGGRLSAGMDVVKKVSGRQRRRRRSS